MAMKVISVAIQKGGQGKTTEAFHLGFFGLEIGLRVLFVDMDPQNTRLDFGNDDLINQSREIVRANLSGKLRDIAELNGFSLSNDGAVASGLFDPKDNRKPLYFDESGAFIEADSGLASMKLKSTNLKKYIDIARSKLETLSKDFDVCIIDTGPGDLHSLTAALCLSDFVISPCTMANDAVAGLDTLTENILQVREKSGVNSKLAPLGILPNMVSLDRSYHKQRLEQLREDPRWGMHVLPVELHNRAAIELADVRPVWRTQRGQSSSPAAKEMIKACMYIYKMVGLQGN